MDDLVIARFSYISIVVLLNLFAAGFFFFSPARRLQQKRLSVNYFTTYFILFASAFIFFGFSINQSFNLFIAGNNIFFILAFYCLMLGFKHRKLAGESVKHIYKEPIVYLNLLVLLLVNTGLFFHVFDFYLIRTAVLISNCILVLAFTVKYIPIDHTQYSYGEKVATASVILSMICGVIVLIVLKVTNNTFFYMSSLVIAQSVIVLLIMGACLTTFLSDVSDMYYREAITDVMTGLYNRRYFFRQSKLIVKSAERHLFPISIIITDIDRFKLVNDTYGHDVGDRAIVHFANIISDEAREIDVIARHGGEEFIILLPQTDAAGAIKLAERIRSKLESTPVSTTKGPLRFTASFGVVCVQDKIDIEQNVKMADVALYHAKQKGRNNVQLYEEEMVMD